jgi:hypothetical protein
MLAAHFSTSAYSDAVFLEVLNEPGLYDPSFTSDFASWSAVQEKWANEIRCSAPGNTILAVGAQNSDINGLLHLEPLRDTNVVYVFHYYEPYSFTHEGEWWAKGSYAQVLKNVPYPFALSAAQRATQDLADNLIERRNALFDMEMATKDHFDIDFEIVEEWSKKHNVSVICDEFGVHRQESDPDHSGKLIGATADLRVKWIGDVAERLEHYSIGWSFWDYSSSNFGLIPDDGGKVSKALGFKK